MQIRYRACLRPSKGPRSWDINDSERYFIVPAGCVYWEQSIAVRLL